MQVIASQEFIELSSAQYTVSANISTSLSLWPCDCSATASTYTNWIFCMNKGFLHFSLSQYIDDDIQNNLQFSILIAFHCIISSTHANHTHSHSHRSINNLNLICGFVQLEVSSEFLIQYLLDQRLEISISYKHSNAGHFAGIFLSQNQKVTYLNIYVHIFHFHFYLSFRVRVSFSVWERTRRFSFGPKRIMNTLTSCLYYSCIQWCVTLHTSEVEYFILYHPFSWFCLFAHFDISFLLHLLPSLICMISTTMSTTTTRTTKIPWCMKIFDCTDREFACIRNHLFAIWIRSFELRSFVC